MPYLAYSEDDEAYDTEGLMGESDEAEDYGEAARRPVRPRFGGPIKLPPKGGNVPPRPATGFATRAELTATANRIDAKIGTVSTGIKALDGRVRELNTENGRMRAQLTAEVKKRESLSGQANNLQQMSMLLPLLSTQKTVSATVKVNGVDTVENVVVDNGDQLSRILPMLMFSGIGGSSQPGSSGGMFGDNNSMMMLALVLAFSK